MTDTTGTPAQPPTPEATSEAVPAQKTEVEKPGPVVSAGPADAAEPAKPPTAEETSEAVPAQQEPVVSAGPADAVDPDQPPTAEATSEAVPAQTTGEEAAFAAPTEPVVSADAANSGEPANPWALPSELLEAEQKAPRRRIRPRTVVAAGIALVTGVAAAVAVTLPARTDVPGLRTPNDGRYAFPALVLPPLPSGKGEPSKMGRHYADLRGLVLPPPKGVTAPPASRGSCTDFAALYQDANKVAEALAEDPCRDVARETWTAKDGTKTDIWLLQFGAKAEQDHVFSATSSLDLKNPSGLQASTGLTVPEVSVYNYLRGTAQTAGPKHEPVGRMAVVGEADVMVVVVMTNPNGVPVQAFSQVTLLQDQMLHA